MASTRTAIIHVGVEKTGSTTIQHWLAAHRAFLLKEGILFPAAIGSPNHTQLVAACLDFGVTDNIKAHLMAHRATDERDLRSSVFSALAEELEGTPRWNRVIISSELISSRLHAWSEMQRLVDLLRDHVDDIHFIVFLRRQDDLAISRFSSAIRAGHAGFENVFTDLSKISFFRAPPDRDTDDFIQYYDYERLIGRIRMIASARLTVLPYRPRDCGTGPLASFLAALDIRTSNRGPEERHNSALCAEAQYLIGQLNCQNSVQWPSGARNGAYRAMIQRMEVEIAGQRRTVGRSDAERFLATFERSNAAVTDEFFPGQDVLKACHERYPDTVDYRPMFERLSPQLQEYRQQAAGLAQREAAGPRVRRGFRKVLRKLTKR